MINTETLSSALLEVSSEQRISIILLIQQKPLTLTEISKKLKATRSEIHRNLNRLKKAEILDKDSDGLYYLTNFGILVYKNIPYWEFILKKKNFFSDHKVDSIPEGFINRLGSLTDSKQIKGFVLVQECQKKIYKNASSYIYNILKEVSYESDIVSTLMAKVNKGVNLRSIFSEDSIISEDRSQILEDSGFSKLLSRDNVERRIVNTLNISLILNEKEACVMFENQSGEIDLSHAFYGTSKPFHKWCFDFFMEYWNDSKRFNEKKLRLD